MLDLDAFTFVSCETHDDLLLRFDYPDETLAEFVQVKSDARDQLWTLSWLTEKSNGGPSIVERQIQRDRGDERVRFRVVTFRDVKDELLVLTKPFKDRTEGEIEELVTGLKGKLGSLISASGRDLHYWIKNTLWVVAESPEAIGDRNFVRLQRWLESHKPGIAVTVGLRGLSDLHTKLLSLVTHKAQGLSLAEKRIERGELLDWIDEELKRIPTALHLEGNEALLEAERESFARCEELWLNLGVLNAEARLLAHDTQFGTIPTKLLESAKATFTWVVGDYGTGKTLMMERLFQETLTAFRAGQSNRLPVFIPAKEVTRPLREEVKHRTSSLRNAARRGIMLFLDAVDELGTERGIELLKEAQLLTSINVENAAIVSSIPLPIPRKVENRYVVQELSRDESLNLVSHFARTKVWSLFDYAPEVRTAARTPLFATLLGLAIRKTGRQPQSSGELLSSLVQRVLQPETNERIRPAVDGLIKLAIATTDRDGVAIPKGDLSVSTFDIQPLIQSRLVKHEDGDNVAFSIPAIRCWFAAEGLKRGMVEIEAIYASKQRFVCWRSALAIWLSACDFSTASRILSPLVTTFPGRAALLIDSAFRDSHPQDAPFSMPPLQFGNELRYVLLQWHEGLELLSRATIPCHPNGDICSLRVAVNGNWFSADWLRHPSAEPVSVSVPQDQSIDLPQVQEGWRFFGGTQPAWVWKSTCSHISAKLGRYIDQKMLFTDHGVYVQEKAWSVACDIVRSSRIATPSIPLSLLREPFAAAYPLHEHEKEFLRTHIGLLHGRSETVFRAPYPLANQQIEGGPLGGRFSIDRYAERAEKIFAAALKAYRELVEFWLPKFAECLPLFCDLPVKMEGYVAPLRPNEFEFPFQCGYILQPLSKEDADQISFSVLTEQSFDEVLEIRRMEKDEIPVPPFYQGHRGWRGYFDELTRPEPATELAYRWLKSDLKALSWIE